MSTVTDEPHGLTEWLAYGTTGASAMSIVAHLAGRGEQLGNYPLDGGDFGRCEHLLDMVPSLRQELHRMADVNAYWAALVARWAEISAAGDKTALINEIVGPIQERDPKHVPLVGGGFMTTSGKITFKENGDDALYHQAMAIVRRDGRCSTSYIQRKLAIGYNKAARLIERMEDEGVVSAPNFVGKREVLEQDDDQPKPQNKSATKPRMKETDADREVSDRLHNATGAELRQFIERVERLEEEKAEIAGQVKEVFAEARGRGYDTKAIRRIIRERKQSPDDLAEQEAIVDTYKAALGM